jgi:hypothetical protein
MLQRRCTIHKEVKQSSYPTNEPKCLRRISIDHIIPQICSNARDVADTRRLEERAGVAASLGGRAAGLTLEPRDEGVNGEALGQLVTASGRSSRGSSRLLLDNGGGNGSSNRAGAGGGAGDRGGGVTAGAGSSGRGGGSGGSGRTAGAEESRAGDGVVDGGGVGAEEDARVGRGVELSADNTLWGLGSGTCNLDVKA